MKLPECGMFIGVPVYLDRGDYIFQTTGLYYTSYVSEDHDPEWYLDKFTADRQGNLVVLWDGGASRIQLKAAAWLLDLEGVGIDVPAPDWANAKCLTPDDFAPIAENREKRLGAGFYRFVKEAAARGLACYSIYTEANSNWAEKITACSNFIGYNAGEAFAFRLESIPSFKDLTDEKALTFSLADAAESFGGSIREYFSVRRANGWKDFFITSGSFHLDFEIASGGNDIVPHMEGFAFANLNFGMALCRGTYKQCFLPLWGCYLAHEHYSFVPYSSPLKRISLDAGYYLAYLNGSKISVQECGSWWQQSDHVTDTEMHNVPKFADGPIYNNDPHKYAHLIPEARKHYAALGYDSEVCRMYRKSVSDFYGYLLENGTPSGQPEVNICLLKGRYDFCGPEYAPNSAIAGAYPVAERNAFWYEGAPERSWIAVRKTFFPLPDCYGEYKNSFFSGTPYGLCDIASLASPLTGEYLARNYKCVIFSGWNSACESDYKMLVDYVRSGGILFVSIPHLAKNLTRNYTAYPASQLVNGGDFTELCGAKIKARGDFFYWALMKEGNVLGFPRATRFGVMGTHLGDAELTDDVEILAVDDEQFRPFLWRRRLGMGMTYFLNSWEYPGALDSNNAPSAHKDSCGLVGEIYRHIALSARGTVYMTDDGENVGENSSCVSCSYFPSTGKTYLLNCDFMSCRTVFLHQDGKMEKVTLAPHEFKIV